MAISWRRVTSFKMAANNEITAIHRIRFCFWYWDAWCVFYTSLKGLGKKMQRLKSVIYWKLMFKLLDSIASSVKCPILHVQGSEDWVFGIAISRWLCHWDAKIKVWWVLTKTTKKWAARWKPRNISPLLMNFNFLSTWIDHDWIVLWRIQSDF